MTQPIDIRTRRVIGHKEGPKVYRSDNLRAPSFVIDELRRPPSLAERIADAIGSEFGFGFYCGVWAGALFTVAAAWLIAFSGGVR